MTLSLLIQKGGLRQAATATPANTATGEVKKAETVARVATVAVANPPHQETDALSDPAAEARRHRVLELLATNQSARYALVTDTEADPEVVILALAIRGSAAASSAGRVVPLRHGHGDRLCVHERGMAGNEFQAQREVHRAARKGI
jgi:hypothetical protein